MSPKRKNGTASKPSAQPKPVATTSKAPAPAPPAPTRPAQAPPAPPAAPSTQRVSPPPIAASSSRPGVTIQTNPVAPPPRTFAQPPKPSAQPARSALAPHLRNGSAPANISAPAAKPGQPQKQTFTRSDRVRAEWFEFEANWVTVRQNQIARELDELFKTAERTSRAKGKTGAGGTPSGMDKIVNSMQRDFALAARDEWDARLQRAGLQAEDWTDMTLQEMLAVEQVLSYEDSDEEPGVYAQVRRESTATASSSGSTAVVDTTPPAATRSLGGWKTPSSAPSQKSASQKTQPSQPLRNTQSTAARHAMFAEDEPTKSAHTWGGKAAPIVDDVRTQSKPSAAPIPVTPSASTSSRAPQVAAKAAQPTGALPTSSDLLVYAVPIALAQPPLDPVLAANAEFVAIVEKLNVNSIRQFHMKAADADAELARQLRKPMPAADREFAIRAHQVAMEQSARDIVSRRNQLIDDERKKRGLGHGGPGGDSAPPPTATVQHARPAQVPGAFPEERAPPVKHHEPKPEPEPLLEYTPDAEPVPEPEPDVDEVIEIPIKGKGKKKGKAAAATKPAANGRSTPTPAAPAASAKVAAPAAKAAPAPETKETKGKAAASPISPWAAARTNTPTPARGASPAPINTKLAPAVSANGRSSPAPKAASSTPTPWEALQAKAASASTSAADAKVAAAQNGIWAPPMARGSSNNKNAYAPTRPSRLAQVTQVPDRSAVPQSPESPEPPSPPPAREPSGQDYVKWFAGSSSEDESVSGNPLDEDDDDEDEDDEDEAQGQSSGGFGGVLKTLAGASPWAIFGAESAQPQRARAASPARGRGATPTPARVAAAAAAEPAYARWGAPPAGSSSFAAGPSAGPSGIWRGQEEEDDEGEDEDGDLDQMLEIASSALGNVVSGGSRAGGASLEDAMAMYVTASKARETLATPVGGRSAWRR